MPKILVVDDEPDLEILVRQRFRRKIREGEIGFVFAHNGVQALAKLREEPDIDMVLSDINMPEMDGLTLLGQLKEVAPTIKAVVVSAYGDMGNIRTAMNRGAFDFITKPIDFEDLERTVARTLEHLMMLRSALASHDQLVALQQELSVAHRMQQQILSATTSEGPGYQLFAHMTPAKDVGGDFYDFFQIDADHLGIAIADVSGKGIPAALFMAVSHTLLRATAMGTVGEPGAVLARVNDLLCPDNIQAMFVTVFYGILNIRTGELVFSNAGHNPPLLIDHAGHVTKVPVPGGIALGILPGAPYTDVRLTMGRDDTLFLYTDGVSEANDPTGAEFGMDKLMAELTAAPNLSPEALTEKVVAAVAAFSDTAPQHDDITCLALRYLGR